ncbi:hypothetical protein Pmani_038116 [Petrolisthes manimaculis]|uniref:Uncharacterized protein n=1 Tax=Petrolisthes manimaculis TaxID=1843537 RepID=A0AAE1TKR0_9EUCA|nr:hypothetical protein Pmani_038116 [Petrolisthes manimaculis]
MADCEEGEYWGGREGKDRKRRGNCGMERGGVRAGGGEGKAMIGWGEEEEMGRGGEAKMGMEGEAEMPRRERKGES